MAAFGENNGVAAWRRNGENGINGEMAARRGSMAAYNGDINGGGIYQISVNNGNGIIRNENGKRRDQRWALASNVAGEGQ